MDSNSAGVWLFIIAFVVGLVVFARMTPESRRALCIAFVLVSIIVAVSILTHGIPGHK